MSEPAAEGLVLVVEDEAYVRASLRAILEDAGLSVCEAEGARQALEVLAREPVQALVTDLRMPAGDGQTLLEELRERGWGLPAIVLTGVGSVDNAVAAMKAGAFDFLQKPADPGRLVHLVRRALERQRLLGEVHALRAASAAAARELAGSSEAARELRALVAQVAREDVPVLVLGESGSGKDVVAACIHRASARAGRALVRVDCAASEPATLLFGEGRGQGGRLAAAEGGTLVLDRVDSLPDALQAQLLQLLEERTYLPPGESRPRRADVRVVALTAEDLAARVRAGRWRAETFWRLAVFPLRVAPLRERLEDLGALAEAILAELSSARGAPPPQLRPEAVELLRSYGWPGNVRELRNVLERALILAHPEAPDVALLRLLLESGLQAAPQRVGGDLELRYNLDRAERRLVLEALERAGGVRKEAAALLGIDARNMGYYLRKHHLGDVVPPPR